MKNLILFALVLGLTACGNVKPNIKYASENESFGADTINFAGSYTEIVKKVTEDESENVEDMSDTELLDKVEEEGEKIEDELIEAFQEADDVDKEKLAEIIKGHQRFMRDFRSDGGLQDRIVNLSRRLANDTRDIQAKICENIKKFAEDESADKQDMVKRDLERCEKGESILPTFGEGRLEEMGQGGPPKSPDFSKLPDHLKDLDLKDLPRPPLNLGDSDLPQPAVGNSGQTGGSTPTFPKELCERIKKNLESDRVPQQIRTHIQKDFDKNCK